MSNFELLAIGALMGYNYAMDKYRADTILEEARRRATVISGQIGVVDPNRSMVEFTDRDFGYAVFDDKVYGPDGSALWTPSDRQFSIKVEGVSKSVCEKLQKTCSFETHTIGAKSQKI